MSQFRFRLMDGEKIKTFYRYEDTATGDGTQVSLRRYYLIKETPKGYWIGDSWYDANPREEDREWVSGQHKRWISKTSIKRFAYPTKEEAYDNFRFRKARYISIMEARIRQTQGALHAIDDIHKGGFEKDMATAWVPSTRLLNTRGLI